MSQALFLSRLASNIGESGLVFRFRARETEDEIDECLLMWRDPQAARFASAIHDPQRCAFAPMQRQLMEMESCLHELGSIGDRCERDAARVTSSYEPVMDLCNACDRSVRSAEHHAADARAQASTASKRATRIRESVLNLGSPPV